MKILLPDPVELDPALPEGWEPVTVDAHAEVPAEPHDADVPALRGPSATHPASAVESLTRPQLVQSLPAGVEGVVAAGFAEQVPIATGAGLHSKTVSEHATALLLTLLRRLPEARQAQSRHEWSAELGGLQPLHPKGRLKIGRAHV